MVVGGVKGIFTGVAGGIDSALTWGTTPVPIAADAAYNGASNYFSNASIGDIVFDTGRVGATVGLGVLPMGRFTNVATVVSNGRAINVWTGSGAPVNAAKRGAGRTNFNVYEVLTEQSITGTGRSAHRISANKALYKDLQANPEIAQMLNHELGADVFSHMGSGSGRNLLNPPGAVWHHPMENPSVMRLLRTSEHNNPLLQPVLHPNGVGGYSTFYGRN